MGNFFPITLLNFSFSIILYLSSKFLSSRIENYFSIECPRISKREMIDWQFREGLELASHSRMIDRQLRKGLQVANRRDRWLKCLRCTIVWYSISINNIDKRKGSKMPNRKTGEKQWRMKWRTKGFISNAERRSGGSERFHGCKCDKSGLKLNLAWTRLGFRSSFPCTTKRWNVGFQRRLRCRRTEEKYG